MPLHTFILLVITSSRVGSMPNVVGKRLCPFDPKCDEGQGFVGNVSEKVEFKRVFNSSVTPHFSIFMPFVSYYDSRCYLNKILCLCIHGEDGLSLTKL